MSQCTDPGAIQDWELDAYADSDQPAHVAEHLRRCPACRARLAASAAFERRLHQALDRFDCPSSDLLRDHYWGYLAADERQRVTAHLETCPPCRAELAELAAFVADERAQPSSALLARAQQAAAQARLVVARLLAPDPRLAPALRGETQEVLLFDADGIAVSVNMEQEETGAYTLFGQVLAPEPSLTTGGYARLTERGRPADPAQAPLDANGGFAIPNLRAGVYQLVVCLPERRIVVPALALKAEV